MAPAIVRAGNLVERFDVGTGLRQVFTDDQGSVRDVANTSGTVLDHIEYNAFGMIKSETGSTFGGNYLYTGLFQDRNSGVVSALDRAYLSQVGVWMETDPIGFGGGQSNLYQYVGNDPINATDRAGTAERGFMPVGNETDSFDLKDNKFKVDDAEYVVWAGQGTAFLFDKDGNCNIGKDGGMLTVGNLLMISVSGKDADKLHWVQYVYRTAYKNNQEITPPGRYSSKGIDDAIRYYGYGKSEVHIDSRAANGYWDNAGNSYRYKDNFLIEDRPDFYDHNFGEGDTAEFHAYSYLVVKGKAVYYIEWTKAAAKNAMKAGKYRVLNSGKPSNDLPGLRAGEQIFGGYQNETGNATTRRDNPLKE